MPRARHRAGAAARDRRLDRRAGALPAAHARARARAGRGVDRRVRGRRHGPRLPRLHRAGVRAAGGFDGRVWTLREVTADRELDRMRDAFVATVSHELRTPLTSISGFLEMMQDEEAGLGATGRQYLDVIRRSTDRLHALVEDLLLIAQIEANRDRARRSRPSTSSSCVARGRARRRPAADEKGVDARARRRPSAARARRRAIGSRRCSTTSSRTR